MSVRSSPTETQGSDSKRKQLAAWRARAHAHTGLHAVGKHLLTGEPL